MKNREHIPPRKMEVSPLTHRGKALTKGEFVPEGYRPYLMLVPEDAPEVDFEAEYRTAGGFHVSMMAPPVWDESNGIWWVAIRWSGGKLGTYNLDSLTKIEPTPDIVSVPRSELEALRKRITELEKGS